MCGTVHRLLYCVISFLGTDCPHHLRRDVYDIELARKLCWDISNEAPCDSARELKLLFLLQAVINEDQEQVRIRAALLARDSELVN